MKRLNSMVAIGHFALSLSRHDIATVLQNVTPCDKTLCHTVVRFVALSHCAAFCRTVALDIMDMIYQPPYHSRRDLNVLDTFIFELLFTNILKSMATAHAKGVGGGGAIFSIIHSFAVISGVLKFN